MWEVYRVTHDENQQAPSVLELIQKIRARPELYLSERSASALWHFIHGYHTGLRGNSLVSTKMSPLSKEFHDWVAYRLHFRESTSGWRNMILERINDEPAALCRFFELFDEFQAREPRIVARLEGLTQQYFEISGGEKRIRSFPSTLLLVSYTEDPGFFVCSDSGEAFPGDGFTPDLSSFEIRYKISRKQLTIVEPEKYHRWLAEENRPTK